jgi:glycine oxidase
LDRIKHERKRAVARKKCVVVGGGIIGCLAAIRLSDAGHEVILLDGGSLFSGASHAALGALTPHSDHEAGKETQLLAETSLGLYPELIERIKAKTGLTVPLLDTGTLELAFTEEEAASQKEFVEGRNSTKQVSGISFLSGAMARQLQNSISPDAISAIHYESEMTIDTSVLLEGLGLLLKSSGCVTVESVKVWKIDHMKCGLATVYTTRGQLIADEVVVCPGCGYGAIQGLLPIEISAIMGEVVQVSAPPGLVTSCIYAGKGFIAPRSDGKLMLGSNYEAKQIGSDESLDTIRVGSAIQTLVSTVRLVPALSECQISRLWKSWRPRTPDSQPVVGRMQGSATILAVGFYGLGITLAPAVAEIILDSVSDRSFKSPFWSISPERFEASA